MIFLFNSYCFLLFKEKNRRNPTPVLSLSCQLLPSQDTQRLESWFLYRVQVPQAHLRHSSPLLRRMVGGCSYTVVVHLLALTKWKQPRSCRWEKTPAASVWFRPGSGALVPMTVPIRFQVKNLSATPYNQKKAMPRTPEIGCLAGKLSKQTKSN